MTPDTFKLDDLTTLAAGVIVLLNCALMLWNILSSPSKKNGQMLEKLITKMDAHDRRISALEQINTSLPSRQDIHGLELSLKGMSGDIGKMSEIMKRLEATVNRHDEHLRKEG